MAANVNAMYTYCRKKYKCPVLSQSVGQISCPSTCVATMYSLLNEMRRYILNASLLESTNVLGHLGLVLGASV